MREQCGCYALIAVAWGALERANSIRSDSGTRDDTSLQLDRVLYRFLVESLTDYAVFIVSTSGTIVTWNSGAEQSFGYTREEVVGKPFGIIFTAQDVAAGAPESELALALSGTTAQHDRWHVRKDATRFWGTNTVHPLYDHTGALRGFTKLVRDTTASHLAYERLCDSEQRHRLLVESVRHYALFALTVDGKIENWPAGAESVFGYTAADVIGRDFSFMFLPNDIVAGCPQTLLNDALNRGSADVDRWFVRQDGTSFRASGQLCQLHGDAAGGRRGFVQIVHDVTDDDVAARELYRRAHIDDLTNLPNRRTFFEHVGRAVALLKRSNSHRFAVLFIDLDHFKLVNDTFGHTVADKLLHETARRLEHCLRSEDIAARIGGDEFAILLAGIDGIEAAQDAAERIATLMRESTSIDGFEVHATVSIGIAMGKVEHCGPEDVLRDADSAMYAAKQNGRSRVHAYERRSNHGLFHPLGVAAELRGAIERAEMHVAYQPIVRLHDGALAGYEALIRWQHPTRGTIAPAQFIPDAEKCDVIFEVDRFMIRAALEQLRDWTAFPAAENLQMSVNISSRELSRDTFLAELMSALDASGLAATRLRLEITEGAAMERTDRARALIGAIRGLGVKLDIDDFGTGYSSLAALHFVSVDALKIDASFVASIGVASTVLLDAVIGIAHRLGSVTIAEGVETAQQFEHLVALGCDLGQGFFFSPPLDRTAAGQFSRQQICV